VRLFENPIFITQRRLVHRAGIIAPVAVGLLVGLSILAALCYNLALEDIGHHDLDSGDVFRYGCYAWLLVVQGLILVIGVFSRISRTLVEERKAGLLDSNRLTPLMGSDLVLGYWLGSPLREFYMATSLVPVGLAIVFAAKLPLELWLGTQLLLFSSALFFGLLAVLAGMAMPRAQGGIGMVAVLFLTLPFSIAAGQFSLTNFVLPVYTVVYLFQPTGPDAGMWQSPAHFFGVAIPPLVYTLALQLILGVFLWRGAERKFGDPHQPAFVRSEVIALFALLVLFQYGLVWRWPDAGLRTYPGANLSGEEAVWLSMVFLGVLVVGIIVLTSQLLNPETTRLSAMRLGPNARRRILWQSGPCTAFVMAGMAIAGVFTQFTFLNREEWTRYLVTSVNVIIVFTSFAFMTETCRFQFGRRWAGYFMLGIFVLYGLPFLLSASFESSVPLKFSLLAPGVGALGNPVDSDELRIFGRATFAHCLVVGILAYFWMSRLRRWLQEKVEVRG